MPEFNLFLDSYDICSSTWLSAPNVDPVDLADLVDRADLVDLVDHLDQVPVDFHWPRHLLCPFLWPRLSWNDGGQGTCRGTCWETWDDTVPGYHVGCRFYVAQVKVGHNMTLSRWKALDDLLYSTCTPLHRIGIYANNE